MFCSPARWQGSAAVRPVPVPISRTRSPGWGARSSSRSATVAGADDDEL
nr:hypothetical protein [Nonomuraea sp. SBT364]